MTWNPHITDDNKYYFQHQIAKQTLTPETEDEIRKSVLAGYGYITDLKVAALLNEIDTLRARLKNETTTE